MTGEKQKPLVSIVICTYNRCKYLEEAIKSALRQNYPCFEIIVVDNNSTDGTKEMVRKYPVRYILETRQGVAYARNTGLDASHGEYVGFIDDDIIVGENWINGILKGFALAEDVAAVEGPVKPHYVKPLPSWLPDDIHDSAKGPKYEKFWLLAPNEIVVTQNSMYCRKKIANSRFKTDLGRVYGSIIGGEDTEFSWQLYAKGYRFAYSPEALVCHIITPERVTFRWFMRRYFCEGLTEYALRGTRIIWRRFYKPLPDLLALLLAALSMNPRRIVTRFLRLCQTAGILYGPVYALKMSAQVRKGRRCIHGSKNCGVSR